MAVAMIAFVEKWEMVPMANGFQCYFRELLNMYLAIRICKNFCRILKIILVPDFCPLKLKIAQLDFYRISS